ncbi:PREDICTED: uncharacterized protein LOC106314337 [Brassica oleracea var. oleracea]|uniref:uncharacterized protein LOC106314337 n=1 Tax=Brassica oleracea var. oleracea TaxID=109376 RepID=UPI0006A6E909|nr:PREDICTED: uncharacterized protein LOC106314337 [Brassica oleracea var. oleracea]
MARRLSAAEKGKGQLTTPTGPSIMRIKSPNLDTSALIKDNALTLIGRLTNPKEQRMWALLPSLPRKWHLQGRAVGSDLGRTITKEKELDDTSTDFQSRVDRYGKSFGNRVTTRQTRNPPPPETSGAKVYRQSVAQASWRTRNNNENAPKYYSPPFERIRDSTSKANGSLHRRSLFTQGEQHHWRVKSIIPSHRETQEPTRNTIEPQDLIPPTPIPTREEVIEELNHATLQYLSCPDPTEAAARRQRVYASDAQGHMEEAADIIIASAIAASNPIQPLQLGTVEQSGPPLTLPEQEPQPDDEVQSQVQSQRIEEASQGASRVKNKRRRSSPFSRSPIDNRPVISITNAKGPAQPPSPNTNLQATAAPIIAPQASGSTQTGERDCHPRRVRARTTPSKSKPATTSPKTFRGASSKKMIFSMTQRSPGQTQQRRIQSQIQIPGTSGVQRP